MSIPRRSRLSPGMGVLGLRFVEWCLVCGCLSVCSAGAEPVDFSRDIQPLLAKRCFSCHGPDTREGGLRLDQQAGATAILDSGSHAIVSGQPADSVILERIAATDPDTQMPPEGPDRRCGPLDQGRCPVEGTLGVSSTRAARGPRARRRDALAA